MKKRKNSQCKIYQKKEKKTLKKKLKVKNKNYRK